MAVHNPPATDVFPSSHFVHAPPAPSDDSFTAQFTQVSTSVPFFVPAGQCSAHAFPARDAVPAAQSVQAVAFTAFASFPAAQSVHLVPSVPA